MKNKNQSNGYRQNQFISIQALQQIWLAHMHTTKSDNLFMDISGIDFRDTNISFSVENILNHEYYPSLSIKPQQKIDRNTPKDKNAKSNTHHKSKKEVPSTPKSTRKQQSKLLIKECKQGKCKDGMEEKDTQDNSQTVKIVHCKQVIKQTPTRKLSKQLEGTRSPCFNSPSNKIQPSTYHRQRTKSNASLKSQRKVSQRGKEGYNGHAVSSNISCHRRNSSSKDRVASKQKIKTNGSYMQEMKKRNENIVRMDYFEEKKVEGRVKNKNEIGSTKKVKPKKALQKNGCNTIKTKILSPRAPKK